MLRHLRRAVLCVLFVVPLVTVGAPAASSAITLPPNVGLACSDGTNLGLALDPAGTLALTDAVAAVNTYPAGLPALACATGAPPASANGPKDFVVGGGQAAELGIFGNNPCDANLSVSAHVPTGTPAVPGFAQSAAGGTFNLTNTTNKCLFSGHIVSSVDCVQVGGDGPGSAQITSFVTKADGAYEGLQGQDIEIDFRDSGLPGGAGDMVDVFTLAPAAPCFFGPNEADQPLDRGNISVRQAS